MQNLSVNIKLSDIIKTVYDFYCAFKLFYSMQHNYYKTVFTVN